MNALLLPGDDLDMDSAEKLLARERVAIEALRSPRRCRCAHATGDGDGRCLMCGHEIKEAPAVSTANAATAATPTVHPSRLSKSNGNGAAGGESPGAKDGREPSENGATNSHEQPRARVTLAIASAAAEQLGEFTFTSLADELGAQTGATRQHVRRLRTDGVVRVVSNHPGSESVFEWVGSTDEPEPGIAARAETQADAIVATPDDPILLEARALVEARERFEHHREALKALLA
jgi:hypothetical protein